MPMEHWQGGSYTSPTKPCRCDSCRADHNRRAREYNRTHPRSQVIKSLRAELAALRTWRDSAPVATGEKIPA